ncbi:MAG: fumarylacetoacetate hydrolase family protein [Cellvibrionaceae bacterium]|nr:fumarylacetoacetate hydrolase family protein [Cellvibrionaceae bacterium]MCV6627320.1 fumarylacetoacetate hydrolase family protein [Cellvibrionaceae bacterium]
MAITVLLDDQPFAGGDTGRPVGKIVCVGRNYADHAAELNNPVPTEPILFIKPATALANISPYFSIPLDQGECHIETEIALLIGSEIARATDYQAQMAIAGIGIGLDLTLRERQSELKAKGLPWEKAKAFDGSCPISGFISPADDEDWENLDIRLERNHAVQQAGNSGQMLTPILPLMGHITAHFTLMPGDIVLTGTPAGVGPLSPGDELTLGLGSAAGDMALQTEVVAKVP